MPYEMLHGRLRLEERCPACDRKIKATIQLARAAKGMAKASQVSEHIDCECGAYLFLSVGGYWELPAVRREEGAA